jgi:hypothetical protein
MMRDIVLEMTCPFCGKDHSVETTEKSYVDWASGTAIQVAMPFLNATEREQLISHICPKCQVDIFGDEE